jgi:hypothetical protein
MLAERQIVNADILSQVLSLPRSFAHKQVEVFVCPLEFDNHEPMVIEPFEDEDEALDFASHFSMRTAHEAW